MSREIDTHSATWKSVAEWAEARLTTSRATLETPGTSPEQTEFQRGRITLLKELLKLPEPSKIPSTSSPGYGE